MRVFASASLVTLFLAPPASAQGAADFDSARALYRQGLELRAAGDLTGSLERLRAAQTLAMTPVTTLEVGRGLMLVGKLVDAREALLAVSRLPRHPDESAKATAAREEAAQLAQSLAGRIPTVTFRFAGEPPDALELDTSPVAAAAWLVPRALDPGHHVVTATRGAGSETTAFDVSEGQRVDVAVRVPAGPVATQAAEGPPVAPVARVAQDPLFPPTGRHGLGPLVWLGLGVAGAGVVTGAVAGGVTLDKAGTLKRLCPSGACPPGERGDLATAQTAGLVSTIAFSVAGGGAVLAVAAWIASSPPGAHAAALRPCVFGAQSGVCGAF